MGMFVEKEISELKKRLEELDKSLKSILGRLDLYEKTIKADFREGISKFREELSRIESILRNHIDDRFSSVLSEFSNFSSDFKQSIKQFLSSIDSLSNKMGEGFKGVKERISREAEALLASLDNFFRENFNFLRSLEEEIPDQVVLCDSRLDRVFDNWVVNLNGDYAFLVNVKRRGEKVHIVFSDNLAELVEPQVISLDGNQPIQTYGRYWVARFRTLKMDGLSLVSKLRRYITGSVKVFRDNELIGIFPFKIRKRSTDYLIAFLGFIASMSVLLLGRLLYALTNEFLAIAGVSFIIFYLIILLLIRHLQ